MGEWRWTSTRAEDDCLDLLIDYNALDNAIMEAIARGHSEMESLKIPEIKVEALKVSKNLRKALPYMRLVQRRLQALRVAGRISFARSSQADGPRGWMIAETATIPTTPVARPKSYGRVAHDAAARAGGWSRRWQYMSRQEQAQWESIAAAVIDAYEGADR